MRNFKIYALGLLFLLLLVNTATGGTRDPDTSDEKYLEFGKKFPGVVKFHAEEIVDQVIVDGIAIKTTPQEKTPWARVKRVGSGVVIGRHWVVTAAHVVENTRDQSAETDTRHFPLTHIIQHPEYKTELYGHYDIALGYSPEDFSLEFYPELHTSADELNKQATIAGFGWHGNFHTGGKAYDGKRRAGSNVVSEIERGVLVCDASRAPRTALEFLICPGDSGGGLFIGNKLAGINSFLIAIDKKPDGTYSDKAAFTRVSLYADWVKSEIEKYDVAVTRAK